jgi:lipopolysaccharide export system permease protein
MADFIAKGILATDILKVFWYEIPQALALSIPISVLTAVLLLFSQMSSDGEITAMKACGVSLWNIVKGPMLVGVVATFACLYIFNELAPNGHFKGKTIQRNIKAGTLVSMLEEGVKFDRIPGIIIICKLIYGQQLDDVTIYKMDGTRRVQDIHAASGEVIPNDKENSVTLKLYDVHVNPGVIGRPGAVHFQEYEVGFSLEAARRAPYEPRTEDMTFPTLVDRLANPNHDDLALGDEELTKLQSKRRVELHKRLSLSMSCLSIVFVGMGLGIRSHRRESSRGVGISLFILFVFYLFVIAAESVADQPGLYPHLILWIPNIVSLILGTFLIHRLN